MEENSLEKKESEIASNNNSNKNGIIAILVVIIIALIGAVIYFAVIKKEEPKTDNNGNNNQQQQNNNQNTASPNPTSLDDSSNYDEWMTYLLNQSNTTITFDVDVYDEEIDKNNISINQVKEYFDIIKNGEKKKVYMLGRGEAANLLTISYMKNNKKYSVVFEDGYWMYFDGDEDEEFTKLIDKVCIIDDEYAKSDGAFIQYNFKVTDNDKLFDNYRNIFLTDN